MERYINEDFKTANLNLAMVLSLEFVITDLDDTNPDEINFCFQNSKELDYVVEKYWNKELRYEPQLLDNQRKYLLQRIYELRNRPRNKK